MPRLDLLDRSLTARSKDTGIPPLENGDFMDSAEFLRRYYAMPEGVRAELIDGIVYMASPVSAFHGRPNGLVNTVFCVYAAATPGTDTNDGVTVRLGPKDVPEPDAVLTIDAAAGGISALDERGLITGPVELAAEVAFSSTSRDLNQKKARYEKEGILEYLVVVVGAGEVRWFSRRRGAYVAMKPDRHGILRSRIFPGLWLDGPALLAVDRKRVLSVLAKGLRSREHAAFVRKLRRRSSG
ncbi:MAG TPA: Uma2 family endonuclease [Planctomycetota bacterium]|nr:Uma2 family endonuclease [Planctomycetota bacterium]